MFSCRNFSFVDFFFPVGLSIFGFWFSVFGFRLLAALICTFYKMQLVSCISRSVCLFVAAAALFVCVACTLTWLWVLFSFNNHFPINTKRVFFTLINTELFINICNKNQSAAFAINQHQKQALPGRPASQLANIFMCRYRYSCEHRFRRRIGTQVSQIH